MNQVFMAGWDISGNKHARNSTSTVQSRTQTTPPAARWITLSSTAEGVVGVRELATSIPAL